MPPVQNLQLHIHSVKLHCFPAMVHLTPDLPLQPVVVHNSCFASVRRSHRYSRMRLRTVLRGALVAELRFFDLAVFIVILVF